MLILTRKKDERIILSGGIEIQIMAIEDGKVKIGIKAPKEVAVYRSEVYDQILNANQSAKSSIGSIEALSKKIKSNE